MKLMRIALLFCICTAARADVLDATAEVSNAKPFVGEAFTFTLKVTVTPGSDLANESIYGLERYPLKLGALRRDGRTRDATGNEVVAYSGVFRPTEDFTEKLELTFTAESVEQRRSGFFSSWVRRPISMAVRPFQLNAQELPTAGRPADFSGAIGTFELTVDSAPREVHVNDLVTRTIRLRGSDNSLPGTGVPTLPDLGPNFKIYAPQEMSRVDNPPELTLRQVIIPLNTNAVEIAGPVFTYFDPVSKVYRRLQPPPEKLTFLATDAKATRPDVKKVDFEPRAPETKNALPNVDLALSSLHQMQERVVVERATPARLAPAQKAAVLFELEPGASVIVAEHAEGWLRVVSRGRAGWIPEPAERIAP